MVVRSTPTGSLDKDTTCRAYAASFYESVRMRQATAICAHDIDHQRALAVLDSEVDAFNNLLATRCGSS
ncbi:hypothetical protein [Bradyrhizobium sp. AS23.2]|uniref:hypothetical protein n=1 Tax=Bradyrhizobium sp. AS23.2 TaxID=1680155 RepID=UPI00093F2264|nr:hypothetical protein [Bradyrhizobium sp. AS23.2]OKO76036.1 hypothetical protein AC630_23615 [Bradyrhizobium sp. AS23.2]